MHKIPRYCYWSICDGAYIPLMRECVRSARRAGVFKEFHVLTKEPIDDCECYDAMSFSKDESLFKLIFLQAAISKLSFDYFIWLDADSLFVSNPRDILSLLGKSPIHVPLEEPIAEIAEDRFGSVSKKQYLEFFRGMSLPNQPYLSGSAFWIVQREAIETVCSLAYQGVQHARKIGIQADVSLYLGYAMQMLCANPHIHRRNAHPEIWASDDSGFFASKTPDGSPWPFRSFSQTTEIVNPAIIHLPHQKAAADQHARSHGNS